MNDYIIFYDDYALNNENYILEKDEVMAELLYFKSTSTTNSIKKKQDKIGNISYSIKLKHGDKESNYKIRFSKRYLNKNKGYINMFDNWVKNHKMNKLRRLKLAALLCGATIVTTKVAYEPAEEKLTELAEMLDDLFVDEVGLLDRDILIHAGYYTIEGRLVYPQYGHGCVFVDDKTISVPERISIYCKENELEYLEEEALKKYNYLYHDQTELGMSIDLKEIEKSKQKNKIN